MANDAGKNVLCDEAHSSTIIAREQDLRRLVACAHCHSMTEEKFAPVAARKVMEYFGEADEAEEEQKRERERA